MIFRDFVCSLFICLRSSLKYSNIHAQFFDCFVYCHFNFFFLPTCEKKSKQIIIYMKIHTRNFERTVIKKWTGLLVFNPDIKNWRGKYFGFVIENAAYVIKLVEKPWQSVIKGVKTVWFRTCSCLINKPSSNSLAIKIIASSRCLLAQINISNVIKFMRVDLICFFFLFSAQWIQPRNFVTFARQCVLWISDCIISVYRFKGGCLFFPLSCINLT